MTGKYKRKEVMKEGSKGVDKGKENKREGGKLGEKTKGR